MRLNIAPLHTRPIPAALVALTLLAAPAAHAIDDPYMWGAGIRVGTIVIPGQYPVTFPTKVENYNFITEGPSANCQTTTDLTTTTGTGTGTCDPKRDLDPDTGEPLFHTLSPVQNDISVGGEFNFYLDKQYRVGALGSFGFGNRFFDMNLMPKVDYIFLEDQIDAFVGGGAGFGYQTFAGAGPVERLKVPYYPLRGHIGAIARTPTAAFQVSTYVQSHVPGNQVYVGADGTEYERVGSALSLFSYLAVGIELSGQLGDFEPPKKKKKKKKGGGKK